jgi:hypothetical protein
MALQRWRKRPAAFAAGLFVVPANQQEAQLKASGCP